MLNVWILQTGEPLHCDSGSPRPMRAMNLANSLVAAGHTVTIWSTDFYHQEKRHRFNQTDTYEISPRLHIKLIDSPGYKRNIGAQRLWDHFILARNLKHELRKLKNGPDIAFVGYPPIEVASVLTTWLHKRQIPIVLDVKDQWPNIFVQAIPKRWQFLGRLALAPYFYYAKKTMRTATSLVSIAPAFLNWSANFAGRTPKSSDLVAPLTTPMGQVSDLEAKTAEQWCDSIGLGDRTTKNILFVGSHSKAFDMKPVADAARTMHRLNPSVKFILCGDGELSAQWQQDMAKLPNVIFPGWVDRAKLEALARRATAALAPYFNTEDFMMSIPNKVVDSMSLGLPLLSPLKGEVEKLIKTHAVGLFYSDEPGLNLADALLKLCADNSLSAELARNSKATYFQHYSFDAVYGHLVSHLETIANESKKNDG